MLWLGEVRESQDKPMIFCLYNGMCFDLRVISHDLSLYGLKLDFEFLIIDPWLDSVALDFKQRSQDFAFK